MVLLGVHLTILLLNLVPPSLRSNQDFFIFHCVRAHVLYEAPPARDSPLTTPFCSTSTHMVKLEPIFDITLLGKTIKYNNTKNDIFPLCMPKWVAQSNQPTQQSESSNNKSTTSRDNDLYVENPQMKKVKTTRPIGNLNLLQFEY